jgi:uncharacterized coiled-coil protein SlyX
VCSSDLATIEELQVFQHHQALAKIEANLKMLRARMNATQELVKAQKDVSQEIMEANLEKMMANEEKNEAKLDMATNTVQEMSETTIKAGQEEMWTTIRAGQEVMMTSIRAMLYVQAEFQETINTGIARIMASIDKQTQRFTEELNIAVKKLKETTWRELEAPVAEVGNPVWRSGSRNAVPSVFTDGSWSSRRCKGRKEVHVCWQCGGVGHLRRDCVMEMHEKQFWEKGRPRRQKRAEAPEKVPMSRAICVPENDSHHDLNAEERDSRDTATARDG